VLGGATCAVPAPNSAQDCNPGHNPGGAFCCLEFPDAGKGSDGGQDAGQDGGQATDSGGADADAGAVTCASAGGQCVAVVPGACAGGTVLDPNQYSCGGGIGVECCLPAPTDGGHPFPCGPALQCDGSKEVCKIVEGGPPSPPDSGPSGAYSCQPIPPSCTADVTCACIQPVLHPTLCSADSGGDVTVSFLYP
jgi:hypothetical protein